jgi:hypothetical protein
MPPQDQGAATMYGEELPFKVVRANSDEVLARAANLLVGRAAYETAIRLFPNDLIQFRDRSQLLAVSWETTEQSENRR